MRKPFWEGISLHDCFFPSLQNVTHERALRLNNSAISTLLHPLNLQRTELNYQIWFVFSAALKDCRRQKRRWGGKSSRFLCWNAQSAITFSLFLSLSLSFFFLFFFSWYLQVEKRTLSNHNTVSPPIFSLSLEIERDSKVGNDFIDECSKHTLIKCVYSSSNQCFSRVKGENEKKWSRNPMFVCWFHTHWVFFEKPSRNHKRRERSNREKREKKRREKPRRAAAIVNGALTVLIGLYYSRGRNDFRNRSSWFAKALLKWSKRPRELERERGEVNFITQQFGVTPSAFRFMIWRRRSTNTH